MTSRDAIDRFFRDFSAEPVGPTPPQPLVHESVDGEPAAENIDLNVEVPAAAWAARVVGEAPARPGEYPVRFIDGSIYSQPVLCLRSPAGWPIPILVAEVGAVALRLDGRQFTRTFALVERLL